MSTLLMPYYRLYINGKELDDFRYSMIQSIVYEDNSIQHFPTHNGSVFAVSAHPTAPLIASGGEDDLGYLWDYTTGEQVVKLTGHSDSVTEGRRRRRRCR